MKQSDIDKAWAEAMFGGMLFFKSLVQLIPDESRPLCAVKSCRRKADYIDPRGAGWCWDHSHEPLHE